jgi:putative ABC transport system permease protein
MGASRGRLIRGFLMDGLVLTVPGVAAGLLFAYGGIALVRVANPPGFPGATGAELNWAVLSFTALAAVAAGLLSAIFPALAVSRVDLAESLKEGGRGSSGRKRERLRSLLVSGEIALALVLLVGAGLMLNSVWRMEIIRRASIRTASP